MCAREWRIEGWHHGVISGSGESPRSVRFPKDASSGKKIARLWREVEDSSSPTGTATSRDVRVPFVLRFSLRIANRLSKKNKCLEGLVSRWDVSLTRLGGRGAAAEQT